MNSLSTTFPKTGSEESRLLIARFVGTGDIDSNDRLSAAMVMAGKKGLKESVTETELKEECLFGVSYTDEEIRKCAERAFEGGDISWDRAKEAMERVRTELRFCEGKRVKEGVDSVLLDTVGPQQKKKESKKKGEPAKKEPSKKKEKKKKEEVAALPAIECDSSDWKMAMAMYEMGQKYGKEEAINLMADSIAALRRNAYAKGMTSSASHNICAVTLPKKQKEH